jgi:hypothetical protein
LATKAPHAEPFAGGAAQLDGPSEDRQLAETHAAAEPEGAILRRNCQ